MTTTIWVFAGLALLAVMFHRKTELIILVGIAIAYFLFGSPTNPGMVEAQGYAVNHAMVTLGLCVLVIFGVCFPGFLFDFGKAMKKSKGNSSARAHVVGNGCGQTIAFIIGGLFLYAIAKSYGWVP